MNELDMKLLIRSRHGVKLTIEGAALYPFMERSIYQYQSMLNKANEIKRLETGIIRVGTVSSITCHWMPLLIKGFKKQYPNVQFLFHQGDYTLISEWIQMGVVDEEGQYSEPMAAFENAGITPDIEYTIHDDYAIMMMVEAGLGVSVLAELMLRRTNYNIICLPTDPPIYRTLAVAYKDKDSLPIASKYFIDFSA